MTLLSGVRWGEKRMALTFTSHNVLCTCIFSLGPQNCSMSIYHFAALQRKIRAHRANDLSKTIQLVSGTKVCVILDTMPSLLCQAARVWQGDLKATVHAFTLVSELLIRAWYGHMCKPPVDQEMSEC